MSNPAEMPDEYDPLAALELQIQQQAQQLEMMADAVDLVETTLRAMPTATTGGLATGAQSPAGEAATRNQDVGDKPARFDFATLYTWVHIHVATITERKVSKSSGSESGVGVRWCTRWYDHDEAVSRLEALRRAWEEQVVKPGASMSTWYLTHYDPHITALTAPGGPFWQCSPGHHQPARPLGHDLLDDYPTVDPADTEQPPTRS